MTSADGSKHLLTINTAKLWCCTLTKTMGITLCYGPDAFVTWLHTEPGVLYDFIGLTRWKTVTYCQHSTHRHTTENKGDKGMTVKGTAGFRIYTSITGHKNVTLMRFEVLNLAEKSQHNDHFPTTRIKCGWAELCNGVCPEEVRGTMEGRGGGGGRSDVTFQAWLREQEGTTTLQGM